MTQPHCEASLALSGKYSHNWPASLLYTNSIAAFQRDKQKKNPFFWFWIVLIWLEDPLLNIQEIDKFNNLTLRMIITILKLFF